MEESKILGRVEDSKRIVYLFGDREAPDPEQFWEKESLYADEENLQAVVAKLGKKPATSFLLQIGHEYGSGLLAVELAYQCALRWPCVVWAETWVPHKGEYIETVYTKEDMERLRAERKTFTSTVPIILDDEKESEG
ncbi:MAG TPA: hypothetical protein VFV38_24175 [Ktedonobacteraceae bacterium]|nr:hypothetical protein [Ktedonobacteraceae bacterium]